MVSEVALAKAGVVMGPEVSRLARNSADWHRLLELCALTSTLILDEDGIYDPASFNDRLLLGLKGTMSDFGFERNDVGSGVALPQGSHARWPAQQGEPWRAEDRPPVGLVYLPDAASGSSAR
ncbi:recombinase family protein [Mesorhizobium australicum]